jgi:hypothetical protein
LNRYRTGEPDWYRSRSHATHNQPNCINDDERCRIIKIRHRLEAQRFAQFGVSAIKWELHKARVFFIALGLEVAGVLFLLLTPTWIGCIFFMAKRSREGYFVDITPAGVSVETPVDRFFIEKEAITRIKTAPLFPMVPSICIYAGRRRIVLRKLIPSERIPEQKRLWHWIRGNAPGRTEIRHGMQVLKQTLENLLQ